MDLALLLYLADTVDKISVASGIVAVTSFVISLFIIFVSLDINGWENTKGLIKFGVTITLVSSLVFIFTPSKDTMYTMAAAYGVQTAAENPNVQRLAGKSLQVLEGKLDEYLKDGKADAHP